MIRASGSRIFLVGSSALSDSQGTGEQAAERALATLDTSDAKLVMVFCSDHLETKAVLTGVRTVTGDIPLIGGTTAGEFANGWISDNAVVVTVLGGPGLEVATGVATDVSGRQRQAGTEVAACVNDLDPHLNRVMIMLMDGLITDHQEVVRGMYSVLGAEVPIVGGGTGDGLRMERTTQLYNDEVLTDAAVSAALASPVPFGIGIQHGWCQVGPPMIVTHSDGNRIYSINDQPALDLYLRQLNAPEHTERNPVEFAAFAMIHPLGVLRPSGGEEMRFVSGADPEQQALTCVAEVPTGTLICLTAGDRTTLLDATDAAYRSAVDGLDGRPPIGFLAFDCVSRRTLLGPDGAADEVSRMTAQARGAPTSGFYTYGEIARTRGINGYHNQTLVVLAMS